MGLPALKIESETVVEERIARLEANVENIQSSIGRLEGKVEQLDGKIDEVDKRLSAKIDEVDKRLSVKIDAVKDSVTALALQTEKSFAVFSEKMNESFKKVDESFAKLRVGRALDKVWWLLMSAAILGVMARGFKWI